MKVGVISRGSPDYLIDIVTDGLLRLVGRSHLAADYNARHGEAGHGPYYHLCRGLEGPEPFPLKDADVLVASFRSRKEAMAWKKATKRKLAIIDGEDGGEVDEYLARKCSVYFKREYFHYRKYPANVRPLPFAAIPEIKSEMGPISRKVFYSWHDNHPFRKEVQAVLVSMGFHPSVNQDKKDYNQAVAQSQIGIAVRGMGWDTYRYWEIPYFGATMLSQRPGIAIPANFEDGREAVFFDGVHDLGSKLKALLEDEAKTTVIGRAGNQAVMERHLSTNRAKTVLEALS